MTIKNKYNNKIIIKILREMKPEKKLLKTFELSDFTKKLFIQGLKKRFPDKTEEEFKIILIERMNKCHNRNY